MATCPNCGGEAGPSLTVEGQEEVTPDGGILVCQNCGQAVDPSEPEPESGEAPPPEASPRGEPGPPRPEDEGVQPEGVEAHATEATVESDVEEEAEI
jgi:hypothetical protein